MRPPKTSKFIGNSLIGGGGALSMSWLAVLLTDRTTRSCPYCDNVALHKVTFPLLGRIPQLNHQVEPHLKESYSTLKVAFAI